MRRQQQMQRAKSASESLIASLKFSVHRAWTRQGPQRHLHWTILWHLTLMHKASLCTRHHCPTSICISPFAEIHAFCTWLPQSVLRLIPCQSTSFRNCTYLSSRQSLIRYKWAAGMCLTHAICMQSCTIGGASAICGWRCRGRHSGKFSEEAEDEQMLKEEDTLVERGHRLSTQPSVISGGTMREYQLQGLNWLIHLYDNGINGILADEMVRQPAFMAHPALSWCSNRTSQVACLLILQMACIRQILVQESQLIGIMVQCWSSVVSTCPLSFVNMYAL